MPPINTGNVFTILCGGTVVPWVVTVGVSRQRLNRILLHLTSAFCIWGLFVGDLAVFSDPRCGTEVLPRVAK